MKIGIIGSMLFFDDMLKMRDKLKKLGHSPYLTSYAKQFVGLSEKEVKQLKAAQKEEDVIREFWNLIQGGDAVLVLNYDKGGVKNYIGGNTLLEMSMAYLLKQKIYLLNPVPEIEYYKDEIEAMKPIVIQGDLRNIPTL